MNICVLGNGTVGSDKPLYKQAWALGSALAKAGFSVCHGGYGGVMEAVARGSREAGGHNTGVTIKKTKTSKVNAWADAEIAMPTWQDRLFKLIELGDAYVFLDGATGTLNELFFVWEMANKKLHQKPIILLGKQLHKLVAFLKKEPALKVPTNLHLANTIEEVINLLGDRV